MAGPVQAQQEEQLLHELHLQREWSQQAEANLQAAKQESAQLRSDYEALAGPAHDNAAGQRERVQVQVNHCASAATLGCLGPPL